ncbi:DUF4158 domain-containing protein [Nonomuraea sp. NPDC051191]|uniref:DUF4158 domain-containing protein n=1 Tax=Nonomuraea sp. NPDC051191 TaxID=3364372 RepID=UPI003792B1FB
MDELIEHWTVLGDEIGLVSAKQEGTRPAFALLLKYFTEHGRFPRGRAEFPDEVVDYVAKQTKTSASSLGRQRSRSSCWHDCTHRSVIEFVRGIRIHVSAVVMPPSARTSFMSTGNSMTARMYWRCPSKVMVSMKSQAGRASACERRSRSAWWTPARAPDQALPA